MSNGSILHEMVRSCACLYAVRPSTVNALQQLCTSLGSQRTDSCYAGWTAPRLRVAVLLCCCRAVVLSLCKKTEDKLALFWGVKIKDYQRYRFGCCLSSSVFRVNPS